MAEEKQGFQNTGLLITAAVLAVISGVLYNVQIARERARLTPKTKKILRAKRDILAGQIAEKSDIEQVEVPKAVFNALENPIEAININDPLKTGLSMTVRKGDYLLWSHLLGNAGPETAGVISGVDFTGYPLELDPKGSVGDIVRVGNYVDVYGEFSLPVNGIIERQTIRILEAVRIVTVGGKGRGAGASRSGEPIRSTGSRRYGAMAVEIKRDEAPVLKNVLSRKIGPLTVVLLSKNVKRDKNRIGLVNDDLRNLKPLAGDSSLFPIDR
ncbi:MAG TPA: hypothetical protein ENL03_02320 [Phycisphaerae bacterium]|nr:hypothetical protein [Phycisphaerae bacterium]